MYNVGWPVWRRWSSLWPWLVDTGARGSLGKIVFGRYGAEATGAGVLWPRSVEEEAAEGGLSRSAWLVVWPWQRLTQSHCCEVKASLRQGLGTKLWSGSSPARPGGGA